MVTAKFSDILEGFEFSSFARVMETRAFVSLERGTVHFVTGDEALDEELPEDIEFGPYLELPNKSDLGLGRAHAIKFAEEHLPEDVNIIAGFFKRPGAFGNFKDFLQRKGQLQAWFDYDNAAQESFLRQWCAENEIQLR